MGDAMEKNAICKECSNDSIPIDTYPCSNCSQANDSGVSHFNPAWTSVIRKASTRHVYDPEELINEHWEYIKSLLETTMEAGEHLLTKEKYISAMEFHYKTAGAHFWKHCKEYYKIED